LAALGSSAITNRFDAWPVPEAELPRLQEAFHLGLIAAGMRRNSQVFVGRAEQKWRTLAFSNASPNRSANNEQNSPGLAPWQPTNDQVQQFHCSLPRVLASCNWRFSSKTATCAANSDSNTRSSLVKPWTPFFSTTWSPMPVANQEGQVQSCGSLPELFAASLPRGRGVGSDSCKGMLRGRSDGQLGSRGRKAVAGWGQQVDSGTLHFSMTAQRSNSVSSTVSCWRTASSNLRGLLQSR